MVNGQWLMFNGNNALFRRVSDGLFPISRQGYPIV